MCLEDSAQKNKPGTGKLVAKALVSASGASVGTGVRSISTFRPVGSEKKRTILPGVNCAIRIRGVSTEIEPLFCGGAPFTVNPRKA